MNKTGICAAAVLLSLLVAACGTGSGSEPVLPPLKLVPFAPTADDDAFYAQPVPMPRLKAGTTWIRARCASHPPSACPSR